MKADFHTHTNYSSDSETKPEEQIEKAIALGLETICITDHHDYGFEGFELDLASYMQKMEMLKAQYQDKIDVRIGVELGIQLGMQSYANQFYHFYPLDFIIGSLHYIDGEDPYYKKIFVGKTDTEVYRFAFEYMLDCVRETTDFDVLGHIDYVVRYGEHREQEYSYHKFSDVIDEILRIIVQNGKGIELNTAGLKYGLPFAHPHKDILKRYRELGGEIITVGSDGHKPEHIAYEFGKVNEILTDCGFKFYTEFRKHKPIFKRLA